MGHDLTIDASNLLEELQSNSKQHTMKVTIVSHLKDVGELARALDHLDDSILDLQELLSHFLSSGLLVVQSSKHFQGMVLSASQDKPAWTLRHEV